MLIQSRFLSFLLVCFVCLQTVLDARTWTSSDGRTFEGRYLDQTDNTVTIIRFADSQRFTIQKSTLSAKDRVFLEEMARMQSRLPEDERIRPVQELVAEARAAQFTIYDAINMLLGIMISYAVGHLCRFPNWTVLRMIGFHLVTFFAGILGGLIGGLIIAVLPSHFLSAHPAQLIIVVLVMIAFSVIAMLSAGSRYLQVSIGRLLVFYLLCVVCQICVVSVAALVALLFGYVLA